MAFWGIDKGITSAYTCNEKDFKRIGGLTVLKPQHYTAGQHI